MGLDETRSAGLDDLWEFYREHATQVRQEQNLRAAVTSTLAGFAGVMIAFAGIDGLQHADLPVASAVIILGTLGTLLSLAHYRKERFHVLVLSETRRAIRNEGGYPTKQVRDRAEERHREEYLLRGPTVLRKDDVMARPPRKAWRSVLDQDLWRLWTCLPALIAVVGVALFVMAAVQVR